MYPDPLIDLLRTYGSPAKQSDTFAVLSFDTLDRPMSTARHRTYVDDATRTHVPRPAPIPPVPRTLAKIVRH